MSHSPSVDIIIAVHSDARPIERAVASVLNQHIENLSVTVVCHNIEQKKITARLGEFLDHPQLRILTLTDNIPSPAGPFNFGIEHSTSDFFAVMGSDDELEAGTIASWLRVQRVRNAEVVISNIRHAAGGRVRTPPTRLFRDQRLEGVRDRLSYRTAQLGLVSRKTFGQLRFSTGLRSGEDIAYGLSLWFSGKNIAFDRKGPAYLVHNDGDDRTSYTARPIEEDFAFLDHILNGPLNDSFTQQQRTAIATKLLRTHVFDAVINRSTSDAFAESREDLALVILRILAWAPRGRTPLSILDDSLITLLSDPESSNSEILQKLERRKRYLAVQNLLTKRLSQLFRRDAPLRYFLASALQ